MMMLTKGLMVLGVIPYLEEVKWKAQKIKVFHGLQLKIQPEEVDPILQERFRHLR